MNPIIHKVLYNRVLVLSSGKNTTDIPIRHVRAIARQSHDTRSPCWMGKVGSTTVVSNNKKVWIIPVSQLANFEN